MNATQEKIIELLKEPTGRSILDSGDYYGRHWERNQGRDFVAEPPVELSFSVWPNGEERNAEIEFIRTAFSFCCAWLDYDKSWDDLYRTWAEWAQYKYHCATEQDAFFNLSVDVQRFDKAVCKLHALEDRRWNTHFEDMHDFVEFLKKEGFELRGLYNEGEPFTAYTYNEDNALDQDIQYLYFTVKDIPESFQEGFGLFEGTYVLLQVHGGCDARGGLSSPKVFEVRDESFLCPADGCISCENGHSWYTDDTYHWYSNNHGTNARLEDYPAIDLEFPKDSDVEVLREAEDYLAKQEENKAMPGQLALDLHAEEVAAPPIETLAAYLAVKHGILTISDGDGLCPICGAKLSGW